jgi:hypothetical protein
VKLRKKLLFVVFLIFTILQSTSCSNKYVCSSYDKQSLFSQEEIVKLYYYSIERKNVNECKKMWEGNNFYTTGTDIELRDLFQGIENFKLQVIDIKPLSVKYRYISQDEKEKLTKKYDCAVLTAEYRFTFNGDYFLYLNNGINTDDIFLVKEKNNDKASWRIWKVYHKKIGDSITPVIQYYNAIADRKVDKLSRFWDSNSPHYKDLLKEDIYISTNLKSFEGNKDVFSIYGSDDRFIEVYPYYYPFKLDVDTSIYEGMAFIVYYKLAFDKDDIYKERDGENCDFVYLVKEKNKPNWKIWNIDHRGKNKQAKAQLEEFYRLINEGKVDEIKKLIYDSENYKDMVEEIANIKSVQIKTIEEYNRPPGGDLYKEGYTFYRFHVSGEVFWKEHKEFYQKDGIYDKFVDMVKSNNDDKWYIYSISSGP